MSYEDRARAAYYRAASRLIGEVQHPGGVEIVKHDNKEYVVLTNVRGVLAVYRVTTQGLLKGLKRWPKEIEAAFL